MMPVRTSIEMVDTVAQGLGDLADKVVFVGGAVTSLYYQDPASTRIRPTVDVDCVVEIAGPRDYYTLEDELRKRHFRNDISQNAPICRWIYEGIIVDVMPTDESILGFSNRWYIEGIKNAITAGLPSGTIIKILTLPYYIATKIEAFKTRGGGDFRMSHDIEDVVTILDAQMDFNLMHIAPETLRAYIKNEFANMIANDEFQEAVIGYIGYTQTSTGRAERVVGFMEEFIRSK